jgi:hypothetical protein
MLGKQQHYGRSLLHALGRRRFYSACVNQFSMLGWAFGRACSKHLSHAHQFGTKFWVNLVRNFEEAAHNGYINKGF